MADAPARLTAALAGRYRIERALGQGGMATVYLAEDLKHKRRVAVKVLKPELAAVLGAERFVQEITTTAALQHPHILPLFDSGEADGFLYYVMPFIDGETLRAKLDRETQLGVDEAVRIVTDVASALHYAHTHGVIHRDIKPENILLHDGRPMVADFGIALAVSAAAGGRMTETGLSLGTPHYMSPEQATAEKDITARSDVYSLGSVLYEILAGQPPHVGGSAQQIIMKIIAEPVELVTRYRKSVPPNVAAALAKALEKLPADRFASAADFAAALSDPRFTTATSAAAVAGSPRSLVFAGWGLALAALVAAAWGWLRPAPEPPVLRYVMALPDGQKLGAARGARVALSPDGSRLVYVGAALTGPRLLLRRRDRLDAVPIPGTDDAVSPTFSPDGQRVAYIGSSGADRLRVVGLAGAPPLTINGTRNGIDGLAWADDGNLYYDGLTGGGTTGLLRVPATGGTPTPITTVDTAAGEADHVWPTALPGARGLLFTIESRNPRAPAQVAVLDLATRKYRVLFPGVTARYVATGHLVYVLDSGELLAVPFDPKKLAVTGEPFPLAIGVAIRRDGVGTVDLAISQNGTLVYTPGQVGGRGQLTSSNRSGQAIPVDTGWKVEPEKFLLSPDGGRLAYEMVTGDTRDVWVKGLPGGPARKLTFGGTSNGRPTWTPDGRTIGFVTNRSGRQEFWTVPADGTGQATPLISRDRENVVEARWSPDGQWLLYGFDEEPDVLHVRRTSGDTTTKVFRIGGIDIGQMAVSPDGRWLAYVSSESGGFGVHVRPFPALESGRWLVSSGGVEPRWARSGAELFYTDANSTLESVEVLPGPAFTMGKRQSLFEIRSLFLRQVRSYDVTPDGQRILLVRVAGEEPRSPDLVVVENFLRDLRNRRSP